MIEGRTRERKSHEMDVVHEDVRVRINCGVLQQLLSRFAARGRMRQKRLAGYAAHHGLKQEGVTRSRRFLPRTRQLFGDLQTRKSLYTQLVSVT